MLSPIVTPITDSDLTLDVLYYTMPHVPCKLEVKDVHRPAVLLFSCILKEVGSLLFILCAHSEKKNLKIWIQPFSVQSLQEGV